MRKLAVLATAGAALLVALAVLVTASCTLDMSYDKYAVVFGVADYIDPAINDLTLTVDDADEMAVLLKAQGFAMPASPTVGTDAWLDADAKSTDFGDALAWVAANAGEDALVVFYFSGHGGQSIDQTGTEGVSADDSYGEFIAFADAPSDLDPAAAGIMTEDELAQALTVLPSWKKIVIIDACNSGGFIGDSADVDGVPSVYTGTIDGPALELGAAISLYFGGFDEDADISPGEALVLAAAGEREFSWEAMELGHGVFTYFLLQTPSSGDENGDGFVTVTEAYDYTRGMIDRYWNSEVYYLERFAPHVSGGPVDYVLFTSP